MLAEAVDLVFDILLFYGPHAVPILVIIAPPNLQHIVIAARDQHRRDDIPLYVPNRDAHVVLQADHLLEDGFLVRDRHFVMMQKPDKPAFSRAARDHVEAPPIQRCPCNIIHRLLVLELLGIKVREQLPLLVIPDNHLDEARRFWRAFLLCSFEQALREPCVHVKAPNDKGWGVIGVRVPVEAVYPVLALLDVVDLVPVLKVRFDWAVDVEVAIRCASSQNQPKVPRTKLNIQDRLAIPNQLLQPLPLIHLPGLILAFGTEWIVLDFLPDDNFPIVGATRQDRPEVWVRPLNLGDGVLVLSELARQAPLGLGVL